MNQNRKFNGIWIPGEVWQNKSLTIHEKVMLIEIDNLSDDQGCTANNKHFCDFFGLKARRIQDIIKSLKDKGVINIEYKYKDGTKEIENRIIRLVKHQG